MENIGKKYDGFTFAVPVHHKQELMSKVLAVLGGLEAVVCHFHNTDTIWIDNIIIDAGHFTGNPDNVRVRGIYPDGSQAFSYHWFYWKSEDGSPAAGWQMPGFADPTAPYIQEHFLAMFRETEATLSHVNEEERVDDPESSEYYKAVLEMVKRTIGLLSFR